MRNYKDNEKAKKMLEQFEELLNECGKEKEDENLKKSMVESRDLINIIIIRILRDVKSNLDYYDIFDMGDVVDALEALKIARNKLKPFS